MNNDFTRIAVVLDRSGSMSATAQATIDGFNEFVNQQKTQPGKAQLLLTQFDTEFETVYDRPIQEVPKLDHTTFVPRGLTALHDAIGKTVLELGRALEATPEADRPGKVIVLILTDGGENASKDFTGKVVADLIKQQREKYSWEFVFLGANQDAIATAGALNIPRFAAMNYAQTGTGTTSTFAAATNYTSRVRSGLRGQSAGFTEEERNSAGDNDPNIVGKV